MAPVSASCGMRRAHQPVCGDRIFCYSRGIADATAVSVGSGPQEILPEDRAWGFAFLGAQRSIRVTRDSICW